jgi:hypothetical protein
MKNKEKVGLFLLAACLGIILPISGLVILVWDGANQKQKSEQEQ